MQRILTTLTAATVLALALTAEANAGHHTQHIQQHNDNRISTSNNRHSIVHHDRSDRQIHDRHGDRHVRFLRSDCRDFRYCCWYPDCDTYIFWYPSDDCWYYWCASQDCYLPFDQITTDPPQANVIPKIPGGLPPVVPGGKDGPANGNGDNGPPMGNDGPPNMPPPDGQK